MVFFLTKASALKRTILVVPLCLLSPCLAYVLPPRPSTSCLFPFFSILFGWDVSMVFLPLSFTNVNELGLVDFSLHPLPSTLQLTARDWLCIYSFLVLWLLKDFWFSTVLFLHPSDLCHLCATAHLMHTYSPLIVGTPLSRRGCF